LKFSLINKIKKQLLTQSEADNPARAATHQTAQDLAKPVVPEATGRPITIRELELLYSVCSGMLATGEKEIFKEIAVLVLEHLRVSSCSIWEVKTGQAKEIIRLGFALVPAAKEVKNLPNLDFEITALVARTGEPVVSLDVGRDRKLPEVQEFNPIGVVVLPLANRKEILGTLNIWILPGQDKKVLTAVEIELAATLAQFLTLGLEYYRQVTGYKQQQRLKRELEIARGIQQGLVPRTLPKLEGVSLEIRTLAANQVGGDYVDVIHIQRGKIGIVIGDVMGKGIPAALFMVMTRTVFRAVAKGELMPHQVLNEVNEVLLPDLQNQGSFVTLFYALYDPVTKVLFYANAGHNPPLAYRPASNEFFTLKAKGVYIGGKKEANYGLKSIQLRDGDIVVFYSDGVKEAMNSQHQQFGLQRIADTIRKYAFYDSTGLTDCLSYALSEFIGDAPQSDDITMAVLKIQ